MRKKTLLALIALLLLVFPLSALAEGEAVSSSELIDRAKDYDNQSVVYEGEIVGDILYRGDYAWLNVFDGSNTIGCYVAAADARQITACGRYGVRGDQIRVAGVFHRACAEHGGDLDIHADTLRILSAGGSVHMPLSKLVTILAVALPLPAAGILLLVWKRRAKRTAKS